MVIQIAIHRTVLPLVQGPSQRLVQISSHVSASGFLVRLPLCKETRSNIVVSLAVWYVIVDVRTTIEQT